MSSTAQDRQPIAALPALEIDKICAGEVVERPLSVVKELIENALDAGATEISIELSEGGKRLIRVVDNGQGIPAQELRLAVLPHYTSKIKSLGDIYQLSTLGFRGEALASLAAVSKLSLSSRQRDSDGLAARIELHGGVLIAESNTSLREGTEVEVSELFFNVPARLKFLRSVQSETSQVAALLSAYALAYPEVRWTLRALDAKPLSAAAGNGRILLSSDGDGDLRAVLSDLLGPELAGELAELDYEFPPMAVRGMVTAPHRHWHNRGRQWFFVNRRPVVNKLLYRAVDDALREFLSPGKFPAGVFLLELPPEEIDVNVHPAKTEVNFAQPQAVYSLLTTALRRALGRAASQRQRALTRGMSLALSPLPELRGAGPQASTRIQPAMPSGDLWQSAAEQIAAQAEESKRLDEELLGRQAAAFSSGAIELSPQAPSGFRAIPLYEGAQPLAIDGADSSVSRVDFGPPALQGARVQQIADSYLVLATAGEVYLIDQHAAHERVLFETLWERLDPERAEPPLRQSLLFPLSLPLSPGEAAVAEEMIPALERLGFGLRLDSARELSVHDVPTLLARSINASLLQSVISELADPLLQQGDALELVNGRGALRAPGLDPDTGLDSPRNGRTQYAPTLGGSRPAPAQSVAPALANRLKYLAATLACKAAIKAGQPLPPDERASLLRLIMSRWSSLTCPHGRPTVIRLGPAELERMFLR